MFCEQFPAFYMEIISCYDIGDSKRAGSYEGWYHTFILGALAMFHSDDYQVVSNRETGNGRPESALSRSTINTILASFLSLSVLNQKTIRN
ncbi:DUF1703-domain-containing protein [Gigaspora margarita]|uniref:DUF1703-domain-containing protein n=1 Tax=Gigaspora margarita TaxID=4874 RepID=A0A8H4A2C4_GIGMA|nr:DUF1703-domain-containing protein [Gigaspora margarita]